VAREASRTREVNWTETEGELENDGSQIVRACPDSYGTETVEIQGRGNPGIVTVACDSIGTTTAVVVNRKRTEYQEREGDFTLRSKKMFEI
jgi:hypothetical protein